MSEDPEVRTLIVTKQTDLATLKNGSILYEVEVTNEAGELIDLPFRTFSELTIGEAVEYKVQPYDHPDFGRTFTLVPKERVSRTKQLALEVAALEERITGLENELDSRITAIATGLIDRRVGKPF